MQAIGASWRSLPIRFDGKSPLNNQPSHPHTAQPPDTFVRPRPQDALVHQPTTPPITFGGQNELHTAAAKGDLKAIHNLLRENKDIDFLNEQDEAGNTPLMVAARENQFNAVQVLSGRRGIDRTLRNFEGKDAYDLAFAQGHHQIATFIYEKLGIRCPMFVQTAAPYITFIN